MLHCPIEQTNEAEKPSPMLLLLRNNVCVAVGFFLLWFFINCLHITLPLGLAVATLVVLCISFYMASYLALHMRFRKAVLVAALSALLCSALTVSITISILVKIFGFPFH
jgi:hypothetical protein